MNSASLFSLAGRYQNPIPPRCLAPIDFLKIPAQHAHIQRGLKYKEHKPFGRHYLGVTHTTMCSAVKGTVQRDGSGRK